VVRALIFDMDGLLIDTERLAADTWSEAARELGFPLDEGTVRGTVGLDHVLTRAYYVRLFGDRFPFDQVEELHRELFRNRIARDGVPLKPGVDRILAEAERLGLGVALGTSSRAVYAHTMLWLAGIVDRFQGLATRDLVQAGKPAPDVFLKAAELLGREPKDCLVFEDSPTGVQAARAAGMPVVLVPDLIAPSPEVRFQCEAVFGSLGEAAEALEALLQGM